MITDSAFSQLNSNKMKVLILLLVLTSGRGMPLGKNGASFQTKDPFTPKYFVHERKSPLAFEHENEASLAFNHFSDENEAPHSSNPFSDGNKAPVTFKRLFPENGALLPSSLDENEAPFISKHLSDEDEAPQKSFYSELISETLHLEKYKEIVINSEADLRGHNFKYSKPNFGVDDQGFDDDFEDDDDDDDNCDNYDSYYDEKFDDHDSYFENWADVDDDDDDDDIDLDVDDATNAILMILY